METLVKTDKLQNYINGRWVEGEGQGTPLYNAITGAQIASATTKGLNFAEVLEYGRTKVAEKLRFMSVESC